MMEDFLNQVRRAASDARSDQAATLHGIVTSYDPANYAVKVEFQPDGTLSGWIPLKSAWVGNGWGLFCPPPIGALVEVSFQEADGGVGSAGLSFFNDEERPLSVPAGEFWLVHQNGASVKLTNDGAIQSSARVWKHTGPLVVDGPISATGNVAAGTGISGSFTTPTGQTVTVQDGVITNIE